jgi:hypothetical protein
LLLFIAADGFVRYVEDWLHGHFLPRRPVIDAYRRWEPQLVRPRVRLADHVSVIAMHVAGVI